MSGQTALDGTRSLFILSTEDRDGLSEAARTVGWRVIGARRTRDAAQRFLHSDSQIALLDLRGGAGEAHMVALLVPVVEAGGGALIVLIDRGEMAMVPSLVDAGATHFLTSPFTQEDLRATLASAQRLVDRLGGGATHSRRAQRIRRGDALFWEMEGSGLLRLSESLARHLGLTDPLTTPSALIRRLPRRERLGIIAALRAMMRSGHPAPFAHAAPGRPGDRLVHHLRIVDGALAADVEWLSDSHGSEIAGLDNLTGLLSRQAALDWLERRLASGSTTALLLSISQFDRMNAAYGEVVGDALLGRIARRIERMTADVAAGSMVARIGGTEFLVGLAGEGASADRATFLARQIIGAIGRPFSAEDHMIRLTARCGIAQSRSGDDATRLLRRASTALADARQAGGEGIRILSAEKRSRQVDADKLETDLRLALHRGEIGIVFQPQYPVDADKVIGVEALARWNHPHYGSLGAGILFATAERSDYLLPLSAHIQAEALRQAAAWPDAMAQLRLSINVTSADIAQPGFMQNFLDLVDGSGFPRARLTVEITESGLIEDVESTTVLLSALRAEGLAVAVDDFGTGYSSLAYLKSLPLDYLKIDSNLAQDIAGTARDRIIVRGVIHMAKSLGLQVIAEGVETEQQLDLLAREGCDYYQGFLRSAGVSSADLQKLVLGRVAAD